MRFAILGIILLAALLAITNPGPSDYERFVDDVVAGILLTEAASLPGGSGLAALGGALASRLARRHTERDNYILFSIYTLDMGVVGLSEQEWRFLGIGTRFIELSRPEVLRD